MLDGIVARAKDLLDTPVIRAAIRIELENIGLRVAREEVRECLKALEQQSESLKKADELFKKLEPILAIKIPRVREDLMVDIGQKATLISFTSDRITKQYRIKPSDTDRGGCEKYFTPELVGFWKKSKENVTRLEGAASALRAQIDQYCQFADLI